MISSAKLLSKHTRVLCQHIQSSVPFLAVRRFSETTNHERVLDASKRGRTSYFRSLVKFGSIATVSSVGLGAYLYWNETNEDYATWTGGVLRFLRSLSVGSIIFGDYVWSMKGFRLPLENSPSELHETHLRCAKRLLELCRKNGGLYIKIGQHIAQLDYLLPDEYCHTLLPLMDACPTQPLSDVYITFVEDLGATPDQLFSYFESTPFASASLAQVHKACTHSGQKVAVKLQHRGLKEAAKGDIATVAFLVNTAAFLFPDFDYQWLVNEVRENLPKELDFIHEARNAERCRTNFGSRLDVTTPDVFWNLSSSRVLTMSFEEGCRLDDAEAMKSVGLSPADVSRIVSEVFNEQIFLHGFVHCDPHIGNILVRPRADKPKSPLIIMLDHGLYRELSPDLRLSYAKMWRSIVLGDKEGIIESSKALGVGDYYELFAQLLTTRPWRDIVSSEVDLDRLKMPHTQEYRLRIQKYALSAVTDISHLLGHLPRPLLLLLKTNDCLRSIDRALGAPLNTFIITARYCAKAIEQAELRAAAMGHVSERLLGNFRARRNRLSVEFRIFLFRFYIWLNILLHALKEFFPKAIFIQREQLYV
ncbi:hypothetical protein GAYE_SCF09G3210 [Galdieria yellowstonensis]|uniref:ABC1 atypical kinase-like domain-containing protein n=1 Tax=Galdieria yellowstonensis TaxID=3028027 RepID=A0AAV9ID51_9RHOD|nr:hypothetical protein GAYE_SCF09G3210 [Galdieria yellowstonensis]